MNSISGRIFQLIAVATLIGSGCQSEQPAAPNFIFILSDDHAAHAISAYGGIYDSLASTPNIDRLAEKGVLCTNMFSTNAICGPSRASILTGKYSHKHGYYKNERGGMFDGSQWTFPKALRQHGYETALIGKWHLASEPQGFDYYKYHAVHGQQGRYWDPVYNENGTEVTEKGYATNLTTDFAVRWLDSRDAEKPFCLLLHYKAPHREWSPDSLYADLWEDIEMPYPETFDDTYDGRELTAGDTEMTMDYFNRRDMKMVPPEHLTDIQKARWLSYGNQRGENVILKSDISEEENRRMKYQRYIKDYLSCIRSVDDNIGRVLDYLENEGLTENTVVVYTSDQGFFLGDHGWFDKRFMYEEALRMPCIIKVPGNHSAGTRCEDILSNIDFAPTLLDLAGVEIPGEVQGRSFKSNLLGSTPANWRQSMYYHYYEYPFWHHVQPHYGIRTEKYKLIHFYYDVDIWEFYDIEQDPNELSNLVDHPEYADTIRHLKDELTSLMEYYGNNKPIEEFRAISEKDFGGLGTGRHVH